MGSQTISSAQRIRELSEVSADVANLLTSAGHAVNALTSRPATEADSAGDDTQMAGSDGGNTLESHKEQFALQTKAYYTGIQAVIARLRRQAYALEEAGIITAEAHSLPTTSRPKPPAGGSSRNATNSQQQQPQTESITNGGLGNFDVGWLNSHGSQMGAGKEAELIAEAKELLQSMSAQGQGEP